MRSVIAVLALLAACHCPPVGADAAADDASAAVDAAPACEVLACAHVCCASASACACWAVWPPQQGMPTGPTACVASDPSSLPCP